MDRTSTASYACVCLSLKYLPSLKNLTSPVIILGLLNWQVIIFNVVIDDLSISIVWLHLL